MDLAGAYYRDGQLDRAEHHVNRALELDYPLPGLALNYLACIAAHRGELQKMMDLFMKAAKTDPQHHVLIKNVETARAWFKNQGPAKNLPLNLVASHEFQLLERTAQPSLPGPLPDDFADWNATPSPSPREPAELAVTDPTTVERRSTLHFGKRLRVMPE
jgi:anaerobic magnesium-protoporphyrin IX monomethyl ester cyclase